MKWSVDRERSPSVYLSIGRLLTALRWKDFRFRFSRGHCYRLQIWLGRWEFLIGERR
jgi:hypothetical protein